MSSYKPIITAVNKVIDNEVCEGKKAVIDELVVYLADKIELDDELRNIISEFKETIKSNNGSVKPKRPPNAYNIFMKDTMEMLKKEYPDMDTTSRMSKASKLYDAHKKKLSNGDDEAATSTEIPTSLVDDEASNAEKDLGAKKKKTTKKSSSKKASAE